ncbi:hypothetical protein ColLi_07353 [Colletotrichum liriopes]|uniref:Uncharacterized protein n=1 Tax=Colletotrichum liriopes TaxID=708192 RepID=A0AA37GQD3_9PEZI|nr:hypothetical protein ColLi_07353 [Colletotrichum liriopes]
MPDDALDLVVSEVQRLVDFPGDQVDDAQAAVAESNHQLLAQPQLLRHEGHGIQTLAASLAAVDDDALLLVIPCTPIPNGDDSGAGPDGDDAVVAVVLGAEAGDVAGGQQLVFLVVGSDKHASPHIGDGEGGAAGGDPLLRKARRTLGGRREGHDGRDVIGVREVCLRGLGRGGAVSQVKDVHGA